MKTTLASANSAAAGLPEGWLCLCVGGTEYLTTRATLENAPGYFATLFSSSFAPARTDAQITARAGKIADHVPGSKLQRAKGTRAAVGQAIASTLGITVDELRTARRAGTSPATLAQQKGVARDTVVDAVVSALKANKPAGAPTLTDAQLNQLAGKIVDTARPAQAAGGPEMCRKTLNPLI